MRDVYSKLWSQVTIWGLGNPSHDYKAQTVRHADQYTRYEEASAL